MAKMHRLQPGRDGANDADAVGTHVGGGQVGVGHAAAGARQAVDRKIEILLLDTRGLSRQFLDALCTAMIEQKVQLRTTLRAVEEGAVVHQVAHVGILP